MLGKLLSIFKKNDESSPEYRMNKALKFDGTHVKYVSERIDNTDEIICKEGHMNISPDKKFFLVVSGIDTVFKAEIIQLDIGELMSNDGVILKGFDLEHNKVREIVAYFKYYR